jgi:TM2 domain-containing membrane protein YozV
MDGRAPAGYPGYAAPAGLPAYVTSHRDQKKPLIAGLCSAVLPGLGQVYNGQAAKGFAVFILFLVGLALFAIPGMIVWLYGMYDAYGVAGKMNSGELPFCETRVLHMILFIVFAVVMITVALYVMYVMFVEPLMSEFGSFGSFDTSDLNRMLGTNGMF